MQATVFCKTVAKGTQAYFVKADGKEYFLFHQDFRRSNKEFFQNGVSISELRRYSSAHSTSVRKTLDKLPAYLRYVEREYGVPIYTKKQMRQNKKQPSYTRKNFRWQDYKWEVA